MYTGTRADHKRALSDEDMKKVFADLSRSSGVSLRLRRAQEFFILMFLLRGIPFVDLAYLRKSDLRDNVITYRRRKTGRPLSVTLTPEAMILVKKYMNRDSSSPYLFPFLESREGTKEAYREYQLALRSFNQQQIKRTGCPISDTLYAFKHQLPYNNDVSIRPRACFFPLFSFLPLWLHYNLNPLCVQY